MDSPACHADQIPLVVVCFGCERVRIAGEFVEVEGVSSHADTVSSTLCPECSKRLYGVVQLPESIGGVAA